ncbi:MAG: DUF971 domain-containing protein [Deltaproteobacteria bacterium]|nr:DUF971 domain-containing protein [Deltaproteobacteria bacterium]
MASPQFITVSTDPKGIVITWDDGHQGTYPFSFLRKACPCALCKGERLPFDQMRGIGGRAVSSPDSSEPSGFASGEQNVAKNMFKVGHYAIGFEWGDGHNTGIYTFDYLRQVCPCEECLK